MLAGLQPSVGSVGDAIDNAQMPDLPFEMPPHDTDEKGRVKFPAYLLSAHKAG